MTPEWAAIDEAERVAEAKLKARFPTRNQGLGAWSEKSEAEWATQADQVVTVARALAKEGSAFAKEVLPLVDAWSQFRADYRVFKTSAHSPGLYDEANREHKDVWERVVQNWWTQAGGSFPRERAEKMVKMFTYAISKSWTDVSLAPSVQNEVTP